MSLFSFFKKQRVYFIWLLYLEFGSSQMILDVPFRANYSRCRHPCRQGSLPVHRVFLLVYAARSLQRGHGNLNHRTGLIMSEMEDANGDSVLESDSEDDDFLSDSSEHMDDENHENNHQEQEEEPAAASVVENRTYIPGVTRTDLDGEPVDPDDLDYDESAYVMYHRAEAGYPCLSFDIIPDCLGSSQERADTYPQTLYLVAGTQAPRVHANKLLVMKMSNLTKNKPQREDENDSDDDEDEPGSDDPSLLSAQIPHDGAVNRVRTILLGSTQLAASWSESGVVSIWDLTKQLQAVEDKKTNELFSKLRNLPKPIFSFRGHRQEGYGLDWSPVSTGYLASGDRIKNIHIWKPLEAYSWHVDQVPLAGHTDSVEDIQWSPSEANVLASCSVDKSIRIWDARVAPSKACVITLSDAHEADVNVISWNKKEAAFLLSGGDDGAIKTWDLRSIAKGPKKPTAIATFKHHTAPITSIEWHPTDSTVFAASSDDNQITLWDLAVEKDDEEVQPAAPSNERDNEQDMEQVKQLPPQLLFVHQGLDEVKELHWHKQMPGLVIATALSGFDVFRTISV